MFFRSARNRAEHATNKPSHGCTTHHQIYLTSSYSNPLLLHTGYLSKNVFGERNSHFSIHRRCSSRRSGFFPSFLGSPHQLKAEPLQLGDVISDIKSLTGPDSASLLKAVEPAFRNYAEAQLLTAKLPTSPSSGVKTVCYSPSLDRFFGPG